MNHENVNSLNSRIWRLKLLRFTGSALDTKTLQLSPLMENGPKVPNYTFLAPFKPQI